MQWRHYMVLNIYTKWRYAIHNNKLTVFSAAFKFKVENFSGRIKSFQSTFQRHSCGNQPLHLDTERTRKWPSNLCVFFFKCFQFSVLGTTLITLNNSEFLNVLLFLWSRIDTTFVYSIATYNLASYLYCLFQNKLETKTSSRHREQCIPAGYSVSLPRVELIAISIINIGNIWHKHCGQFLRFVKFSLQLCESCAATYWSNYVLTHNYSCDRRWKRRPIWSIIGDPIFP